MQRKESLVAVSHEYPRKATGFFPGQLWRGIAAITRDPHMIQRVVSPIMNTT